MKSRYLITSANSGDASGLYMLETPTGSVQRLLPRECIGLARVGSCYVLGCHTIHSRAQGPGHASSEHGTTNFAPHSLLVLNSALAVECEIELTSYGIGDVHDIHPVPGGFALTDTFGNRLVGFRCEAVPRHGAVPAGGLGYLRPDWQCRDRVCRQPDASHLTGFCLSEGRLLVAAFGRFAIHREYKHRQGLGVIMDMTELAEPFARKAQSDSEPQELANELADPHNLTVFEGSVYLAEASRGRVLKNYREFWRSAQSGYLRGLSIQRDKMLLGLSQPRRMGRDRAPAQVVEVDFRRSDLERSYILPTSEVYNILNM